MFWCQQYTVDRQQRSDDTADVEQARDRLRSVRFSHGDSSWDSVEDDVEDDRECEHHGGERHRRPAVQQVFCFENRGEEIGVTTRMGRSTVTRT